MAEGNGERKYSRTDNRCLDLHPGYRATIAFDLAECCECFRQLRRNAGLAADGDRLDQELPGVVVPVFASPLMRLLHKIVGCTGHGGSRLSLAPVQLARASKGQGPTKANCESSKDGLSFEIEWKQVVAAEATNSAAAHIEQRQSEKREL